MSCIKLLGSALGSGGALSCILFRENLSAQQEQDSKHCNYGKSSKRLFLPGVTEAQKKNTKWDFNWDRRDPAEIYFHKKEQLEMCNIPHKSRHIYLVRHGQYFATEMDKDRILTELGQQQAELVGMRLKELNLKFDKVVISTMARAKHTADIILKHIPQDKVLSKEYSSLLPEGNPVPPEPSNGRFKAPMHFYTDGARIEAAFRQYFHRATPTADNPERILLICHANVIRYFVCRALQLPADAWLRFSLKHGSITHIEIKPSGRVVARSIGDVGFLSADKHTTQATKPSEKRQQG